MKVYFVGAGPGDPDLLTVKAHRLLMSSRICVFAGSLVNPELLKLLPAECVRHDSASMTLDEILGVFRKASHQDLDVIRLHSGDPAIYGAIGEQMRAIEQLGIDYEVVPGVSSFQAAAAALRTELTAPEIAQTIILTRTPGRTPMPVQQHLDKLAESRSTLCIFLSTPRLGETVDELIPHYGTDCPVGVVYHASWPDQISVRGTLGDIREKVESAGVKKTAMIIVGHALGRDIPASRLYDGGFSHGFRTETGT
ncbi:MAG: precorrin-4 C(11)-methyltransferase [Thermodesulfobacteriota bacterium]